MPLNEVAEVEHTACIVTDFVVEVGACQERDHAESSADGIGRRISCTDGVPSLYFHSLVHRLCTPEPYIKALLSRFGLQLCCSLATQHIFRRGYQFG